MQWKAFNVEIDEEVGPDDRKLYDDITALLGHGWRIQISHIYTRGNRQFLYVFMTFGA